MKNGAKFAFDFVGNALAEAAARQQWHGFLVDTGLGAAI
jgi:hypothetical protein